MTETESAKVTAVFSNFVGQLENEADLRDDIKLTVKDIDRLARELIVGLSAIHMSQNDGPHRITDVVNGALQRFALVRTCVEKLVSKVPVDLFYVFHENWRWTFQKLSLAAGLVIYLQFGRLATLEEAAAAIGVASDRKQGFHLDLEDYLTGLLNLASELSRYCVNRVTAGDYQSPGKIFTFITELGSGFRLLNLKNNDLRRRFDALKYDEKKVEEVIYDLRVRGLLTHDGLTALPNASAALLPSTTADSGGGGLSAAGRDLTAMQE